MNIFINWIKKTIIFIGFITCAGALEYYLYSLEINKHKIALLNLSVGDDLVLSAAPQKTNKAPTATTAIKAIKPHSPSPPPKEKKRPSKKTPATSVAQTLNPAIKLPQKTIFEQAQQALKNHNWVKANQLVQQVLAQTPQHIDAQMAMAGIHRHQQEINKAITLYESILRRTPDYIPAQAELIDIASMRAGLKMVTPLQLLIKQNPHISYLNFKLGHLFARHHLWDKAQKSYFNAFKLEPHLAIYAYHLAVSLDHLKQPKEAAHYYAVALSEYNHSPNDFFPVAAVKKRLQQLSVIQ